MPLDPSISLQAGQGVRPLDPMGAFQQALTLRALSDQSQAQQLALQQQQRAMQRQEGIGKAYAVGPDGQIDRATTLRNLASGGYGPEAAQFSHQSTLDRLASEKAQRESEKAQFESVGKRVELRGKVMGALRDDASYLDAIRAAQFLNENGDQIDITQISQDPAQRARQIQQFRMHASTEFENYRKQFGPQTDTAKAFIDMGNATPEQLPAYRNMIAMTGGKPTDYVRFENGVPTSNETAIRAAERVGKASATKIDNANYAPGAIGPGKTTVGKIEEDLRSSGGRLSRLTQIERMFKPEFLNVQNRLSGSWSAIKEKLGANLNPKDKRFLAEFSQFKQSSIEQLNQYINEVTGAAVGVQEAPRLISAMPNPGSGAFDGDSPTEFKTKLDSVIKQVKMAEARQVYALRNGLSLFDGKGNPLISLEKMPKLMQDRGKELEAEMRKKFPQLGPKAIYEKVANQLGSEFGLASD